MHIWSLTSSCGFHSQSQTYCATGIHRFNHFCTQMAQHECVESAKLWYNHISTALVEQGFSINEFDRCVFQKQDGETWTYITLYEDNLLIASDKVEEVNEDIKNPRKHKDLTVKRGKPHEYLGIRFDFSTEGDVFLASIYKR